MTDADHWRELEYAQLRHEILHLADAARSAVRFFLPAAAVVYTVPSFLKDAPKQEFLWMLCPSVAALLLFAMAQAQLWSVRSIRRIGMYIKEAIEPETNGGLKWETIVLKMDQESKQRMFNEIVSTVVVANLANVGAALSAGMVYLGGIGRVASLILPTVLAMWSIVLVRHAFATPQERQQYSQTLKRLLAESSEDRADVAAVSEGSKAG